MKRRKKHQSRRTFTPAAPTILHPDVSFRQRCKGVLVVAAEQLLRRRSGAIRTRIGQKAISASALPKVKTPCGHVMRAHPHPRSPYSVQNPSTARGRVIGGGQKTSTPSFVTSYSRKAAEIFTTCSSRRRCQQPQPRPRQLQWRGRTRGGSHQLPRL